MANNMNLRYFLSLSLVANVVLLVCLTCLMIKPSVKPSVGSQVAAGLDMKAGYENGPIILLLDNEFDKNASCKLFDKDQELMISKANAPSEEDGMKYASISLGIELELACYYVPGPESSFRKFQLTMGDRLLEDLNADGQYDLRLWLSSEKRSNGHPGMDVWFNNEWQEVIGGAGANHTSVNTLKDDVKVSFDRTSGRWVPLTPDAK
jgi:hypothetical protein